MVVTHRVPPSLLICSLGKREMEVMDADLFDRLSRNDLIKLLTLSHQSLACSTKEQLVQLVLDLKELFAFENAVCAHAKMPDAFIDPDAEIDTVDISYPSEYMNMYFDNNLHITDAVLCEFLTNLTPVNWLKVDQRLDYDYPAARLAMDFNMKEGWSYGTLDSVTMTCTFFSMGGKWTENDIRTQKILEYIIPFYSEAYKQTLRYSNRPVPELTKKEVEVLHWVKEGKSTWEISVILQCSSRTVNFHVNNIKKKLNSISRAQAVAIGLHYGIITF